VIAVLILVVVPALAVMTVSVFLLGYTMGSQRWESALAEIHLTAAAAEQQLHDLTEQAMSAMTQASRQQQ
jgi:hypothetical protein